MAKVLTATPDVLRGLVQLRATGVPNGTALVTRQVNRLPEPIRGGDLTVSTGGFIKDDPEPPFGQDLIYQVTLEPSDRHIQTNRAINPKAKNNTTGWTAGPNRVLTRDAAPSPVIPRDAVTALQIGPNQAGGAVAGIPERTLASTVPLSFGAGRWYISGQMKYLSPDIWLWSDARDAGTWQTIKDRGTWQQVKNNSSVQANEPFASLWCAVLSPTDTVVVAPFQIIGATTLSQKTWRTFQGWVDVPVGAPAGSRLVFLHGAEQREFSATFWLTTLMVTPESEMDDGAVMPYFDGDTVLPVNPAANLVPGYDWFTISSDASMAWSGTDGNSSSVFTGPSVIGARDTTRIDAPGRALLPRHRLPMMLSDPILPQVSVWFELIEIGDLTFAARQDLYDVISRGPRIAVSSQRAWADGEFRLVTYTLQQAAIAERMFAPGRILFMRNPDPDFPENTWYLAIGDVTQGRVHPQAAKKPERIWRVPFARIERPVGLIAAAGGIDWQYVRANYTWDELRHAREDWLDVAVTPA